MFSPSVALGPDKVNTEPTLMVCAGACAAHSAEARNIVPVPIVRFTLSSSQEKYTHFILRPAGLASIFLVDLYAHLLDNFPVLVVVAPNQVGEFRRGADVGLEPSGRVEPAL